LFGLALGLALYCVGTRKFTINYNRGLHLKSPFHLLDQVEGIGLRRNDQVRLSADMTTGKTLLHTCAATFVF
jgi:hypothetical protein